MTELYRSYLNGICSLPLKYIESEPDSNSHGRIDLMTEEILLVEVESVISEGK